MKSIRKAIHIPSQEQKSVSLNNLVFLNSMCETLNLFTGRNTTEEAIKFYQGNAPVNDAIDLIADCVGGLPLAVLNIKTGKVSKEHAVLDLIRHPNNEEQQSKHDFMRDITIWRIIDGNSFVDATGDIKRQPLELFVLKPQNITITQSPATGFAGTYSYSGNNSTRTYKKDPVTGKIYTQDKKAQLLHIKNFSTVSNGSNLRGESEIIPSLYLEISQYTAASNHNLALLKNGARPSGALMTENTATSICSLNADQVEDLKAEVEKAYQGAANAGRPMLLGGGLKWVEMSLSPKDMDFLSLKKESEIQIYKNLGIPIEMRTAEASTFNNKVEAKLEFYENRIIPLANNILNSLNNFLMPRYKDGEETRIVIDIDEVEALAPKKEARRKSINDSVTLTLNEKREMQGFGAVEGGNQVFTAAGLPIAGDVVSDDEEMKESKEDFIFKMKQAGKSDNIINEAVLKIYGKK